MRPCASSSARRREERAHARSGIILAMLLIVLVCHWPRLSLGHSNPSSASQPLVWPCANHSIALRLCLASEHKVEVRASEILPTSLPSAACNNDKTIVTRGNWDPLRFATCHLAPFYVLLGIRLYDASACMPLVANTRICDKFRYSDRLCDDTLPRVLTVRSPVHYRLLIASSH